MQKYDDAITEFDKSIAMDNNFAYSYLWKGNCYAALGKRPEAVEAYKKVLEIDPNNQDAKDQLTKLGEKI
jgi:tetratricopeptide (TPR) repeat protein